MEAAEGGMGLNAASLLHEHRGMLENMSKAEKVPHRE